MRIGSLATVLAVLATATAGANAASFDNFDSYTNDQKIGANPGWLSYREHGRVRTTSDAYSPTNALDVDPSTTYAEVMWTPATYSDDVRAAAYLRLPSAEVSQHPRFALQRGVAGSEPSTTILQLEFHFQTDGGVTTPGPILVENRSLNNDYYYVSLDGQTLFNWSSDWTLYEMFWSEDRDAVAVAIGGQLIEHYYSSAAGGYVPLTWIPVSAVDDVNRLRFSSQTPSDALPYLVDDVSLGAGSVPEPASLALLCGGLVLTLRRR